MGAGNVKAVFGGWGHLPHAAFRVLAYMALRTRDADDPPMFYGGREELAVALGRGKADDAAFRAVRKTVVALADAGAISRTREAVNRRRAEYALNLSPPLRGHLQGDPQGLAQGASQGLAQPTPQGSPSTGGELKDLSQEKSGHPPAQPHVGAHAPASRDGIDPKAIDEIARRLNVNETDAHTVAAEIRTRRTPRDLAAYVGALGNADLQKIAADVMPRRNPDSGWWWDN